MAIKEFIISPGNYFEDGFFDGDYTLSASVQVPPIISFAVYSHSSTEPLTKTWTGDTYSEVENSTSGNLSVRYKIYNPGSTPANITLAVSGAGGITLSSFIIKINN
jgi:hypothetical protein